jgi:hypothetical protein
MLGALLVITPGGYWRNPLSIIQGIDLIDMLTIPLYLIVLLFIIYLIQIKNYNGTFYKNHLLKAATIKLIAAIAFAMVYVYHYDGIGDTFYYFEGSKPVQEAWFDSPELGLRVMMQPAGDFEPTTFPYTSRISGFWRSDGEMVSMCKIVGTVMILSFQSYWLTTLLVAFLGFSGLWKLFRFFSEIYPELVNKAAIAVFYVPSALFWGSGILKDTVCFGALGWIVWCMYQIFSKKHSIVFHSIVFVINAVIILSLKAYIFFAFIPAMGLWLIVRFKPKNESIIFKYTLTPAIVIIAMIGLAGIIQNISQSSDKYAVDNLEDRTKGFHSYHGSLGDQGQSTYSLGNVSYTPLGILQKFPAALNVTYFRPYLWEARDPFQLLSSLEGLFFLFLFVQTLKKVGIFNFLNYLTTNPEVIMCLTFAILFGFAVGFTAYNFGALVRFKIPALPFFIFAMYLIQYLNKKKKETI